MRTLCALLLVLHLIMPLGAAPSEVQAAPFPYVEAGRKLLTHYGWTCGPNTVEMAYTLPPSLGGNPEAFYQRASEQIGLDLAAGAGQEITLVRYTLSRRSQESNSRLFAHVAFHGGRVIGAWLSTDAPIAPGIAALDTSDFGHDF